MGTLALSTECQSARIIILLRRKHWLTKTQALSMTVGPYHCPTISSSVVPNFNFKFSPFKRYPAITILRHFRRDQRAFCNSSLITLLGVYLKKNSELRIQSSFSPSLLILTARGSGKALPQQVWAEPDRQTVFGAFRLKIMPHTDLVFVKCLLITTQSFGSELHVLLSELHTVCRAPS